MRILLVILITIFFIPLVFSQEPDFKRYDITPANVSEIGGLNTYKNSHYMLISTSVFFSGRMRESSEARSIRQKYDEWEIHNFVPDTVKGNMNNMWSVKNASPNGFSILDDNTVVYIDKQKMIRTNDPVMDKQLKSLLDKKFRYSYPSVSGDSKKIYFSSDMPGGFGGFDIWYIEKEGYMWSEPRNAGESINSANNEYNTLQINDTVMVFSSDRKIGKGVDLIFCNTLNNKVFEVNSNINTEFDEIFLCNKDDQSIIVNTRKSGADKIYSVRWYQERKEEEVIIASNENLLPTKIQDIDDKPVDVTPKVVEVEEPENMSLTKFFELKQYDLTPQMIDSLTGIANKLINDQLQNILICGHASPDGTDFINMKLSYYRANTASDWLIEHEVPKESIFRIYGGEYLFSETISARRFSLFSLNMTDIPNQLVVIKMDNPNQLKDILARFDFDYDEAMFIKKELSYLLPVDDQNLVLMPVSDLFFTKEGDTLYSIAKKYGISMEKIKKVNGMKNESISADQWIYIPVE